MEPATSFLYVLSLILKFIWVIAAVFGAGFIWQCGVNQSDILYGYEPCNCKHRNDEEKKENE